MTMLLIGEPPAGKVGNGEPPAGKLSGFENGGEPPTG
jgi:hypothetical protein